VALAAVTAGARGGGSQHGRAAVGCSEADAQWGISEDLLPHPRPQEVKTDAGWAHNGRVSMGLEHSGERWCEEGNGWVGWFQTGLGYTVQLGWAR
jgi:hypothetical protein